MSYFYVKNSLGTRTTGGGTTKQTGSFTTLGATNVYATIVLAIADGAADGDVICCSDAHDYDAATTAITYTGNATGPLCIESVADANCDTYSAGAREKQVSGAGADIGFAGNIIARGMAFESSDVLRMEGAQMELVCHDCSFVSYTDGVVDLVFGDGNYVELNNTTIAFTASAGFGFEIGGGALFKWNGGSFTSGSTVGDLFESKFDAGGATVEINDVDLSIITGYLVAGFGASRTADDLCNVKINRCKLNSGVDFVEEALSSNAHRVLITNSANGDDIEYQYHYSSRGGAVDDIDTIYRNGSTAFASGAKISLKCVTLATAIPENPFTFDFPTRFAAMSASATDLLRIYIVSSATLTDADVYAQLWYPDGTNTEISNTVYSVANAFTSMRTGTTLATNTEAWTSPPSTPKYYQIDLDTSGDVGADGYPTIRLSVAKASATIYFCTDIDLS